MTERGAEPIGGAAIVPARGLPDTQPEEESAVCTTLEEFFERLESSGSSSRLVLVRWNRAGGAQSYLHVTDTDILKGFCDTLPPGTNVVVFDNLEPPSLGIADALGPIATLISGDFDWLLVEDGFKPVEAKDRTTTTEKNGTGWHEIASGLAHHLPFYETGRFVYELEEAFPGVEGRKVAFYPRLPSWDTDRCFEIFIGGVKGAY